MEFAESKIGKVIFARFVENEDILETATDVAEKAGISVGFFFLIGTLKKAKLGFFREGKYEAIEMNQPLEIVSCLGNVSIRKSMVFAHAHIAVSNDKGIVFGGHVMPECIIGATGELVLVEAKGLRLIRKFDEEIKLHLWSLGKPPSRAKEKRSA
jgi:predicted DNA-binding protein with PD1-like motif